MITVRKLLEEKKQEEIVYSVGVTDSVLQALQVMADADTGAVLVSDGDQYVGIFTERDYAREGELKGLCAKDTQIKDVMTQTMVSVKPETTMQECMELMAMYGIRHLPVVSKARVIGMVSIRDVVRAVTEDDQSTIHELENYIQGTGYGR
ncbi:MAG: CBS domain-containing protein [Anaerolineales bacterium]|jgi:CBS domain-containing protein